MAGDDYGDLIPYSEGAGGASTEANAGIEIGRVDLVDKTIPFKTEMLFGERIKRWIGTPFVGGAVSHSVYQGINLISSSINIGISISLFLIGLGVNKGLIDPKK